MSSSDPNFEYGRWLSSPPHGDEVVISGMSGRLPESNNIHEFRDHLFAKEEMVSSDGRRWKLDHHEIPQRTAKLLSIDRYDAGYFGVHYRQAEIMDPMMRLFMETTVEAIMDAGIHPQELEGTRTGVFVSSCWSDMEVNTCCNVTDPQCFAMTGYLRSLNAHRVSYFLKLKGPAFNVDTACSSSLNGLDAAFKAIRSGQCENAIVGGSNLLLHPGISLQFFRLGVLSRDGTCRVFDQDASGYVRGEAVACVFLQKAKNSRRIYARIINTKTNGDGFKEQGITFPSPEAQRILMTEIYKESDIEPSQLSFLEAHGTGTQVGDPQEVEAIDLALAQKRSEQLLVGSVKSSIGHTEPASGVCSIIKVLLAMETGLIAPNINLKKIKEGMNGFEEGRMKVVTELAELKEEDAVIGLNNFGFGGNNAHTILKRHVKTKSQRHFLDDTPRLVCVSGRSELAVQKILTQANKTLDEDYVSLLHQLYKTNTNNFYRGYTILTKNGSLKSSVTKLAKPPLYVFFGQFAQKFKEFGLDLLRFETFKETTSRINKILQVKISKTLEELLKGQVEHHENILGSICVQVALVDTFKALQVEPTAIYADSYSKLVTAYYYNVITLQETISAAVKVSQLDFNSDLHFQTEIAEDKLRGHSLSHDALIKLSNNVTVLNVSDSSLGNKDVLLADGKVKFLETLGRLFQEGHNLQVFKLYPKVEFPVSRGTPMISPFLDWDHSKQWYAFKFSEFTASEAEQREYSVGYLYEEFKFIAGHVIDERNLFPAIEYLHLVWQTFAQSRRLLVDDLPVVFTDCKFIRAVTMPKTGFLALLVTIQRGTGNFEILEKNTVVVTGKIRVCGDTSREFTKLPAVELENDPKITMEKDEIYRELYLRGYNYSGVFKGIEKINTDATAGLIKWEKNWTSFIDKMLQMQILTNDTRLLFVPVGIKKLVIDPAMHIKMAEKIGGEEVLFFANTYSDCNTIKSGGVEISGLQARSISRRKPRLLPVLEKNVFVPNYGALGLEEAIRVNTQIILENSLESHFKAVEIVDEYTSKDPLLGLVSTALDDLPVVTPDLTISSKSESKEVPGVKIEVVTLTSESNVLLVIGTKLLERPKTLKQLLGSVKKSGFVLTREDVASVVEAPDLDIVTEFQTPEEKLVLLRKSQNFETTKYLPVSSSEFEWLPQLQASLTNDSNIVVYAKNEEGLLGLVNCIRREPNGGKVKGFFLMENSLKFTPNDSLFADQIKKGLAVNVFKDNTWGTYRHLLLEKPEKVETEHFYANVTSRGDISSLKWLQGPSVTADDDAVTVEVYYSAVNFKDIMAASGRVNVETFTMDRVKQECILGFEVCGKTLDGRRVATMVESRALSSILKCPKNSVWDIPPGFSLEDAATLTVVYSTVLYALYMIGNLKPGSSILIHSGTGGIGLAAITVCLYHNCEIFVTVGTQEKRDYLKKHYPQLPESHIGNSRDTSFEDMIKTQTKNRGVDYVLNSLAEDKLKASLRCLARGGCFLEIGKFDIGNDTALEMLVLEKEASFHGIMLDKVFTDSEEVRVSIFKRIIAGLKAGYVKPLPRVVFEKDDLEASYRFMMTGKHIGKVLIKMRDEEKETVVPEKMKFRVTPRYNCDSSLSYIIIGGLGGIGLELADWLVLRGARKLILVSRTGVQTGYQTQRIKMWSSYGVQVYVSTKDVTTKQGCVDLIKEAEILGPVDAIFNLAVVLKDALLEDQTEESFSASLAPKAQATTYLDQVTREFCPKMRSFVVFSSVSCGRGNPGQSNYGMANSIMERICEKRKKDGFSALAVQWGAVGEVGLVAKLQKVNKELVIGGTLQQKVSSCFEALNTFLIQDHPIVSSMVVAEKHNKSYGIVSAVDCVAQVLGIKDLKTVSQHATLAELGMDSMMGTEILQLLEKDFEIYISPKDMRSLTFAKLTELEIEKNSTAGEKNVAKSQGADLLMRFLPNTTTSYVPIVDLKENVGGNLVFLFPGIDGGLYHFKELVIELEGDVKGVQYRYNDPEDTIEETAKNIALAIEESSKGPVIFLAYSYGADVAVEVASLLEPKGLNLKLILIDGAPNYLTASTKDTFPQTTEAEFQTAVINKLLGLFCPIEPFLQNKEKLVQCDSIEERVDLGMTLVPKDVVENKRIDRQGAITMYKRFKSMIDYKFSHKKLSSEVYLFKAKNSMVKDEEDYQLSKICENLVRVVAVEGDHVTMINQPELAKSVNEVIVGKS